ncbi:MAG: precorrin-8X methylmutase [Magnetovibrio sp.]|nr:precorrin-8X methylmutase [Magnetovibrio sp.]
MTGFDYLRDPKEIYRQSFATLRAEVDFGVFEDGLDKVVERLIHSCGMPEIAAELAWDGDPAGAGRRALAAGRPVLTDAEMVRSGIIAARLPAANTLICTTHSPVAFEVAADKQTTRSAAAVEQWEPFLDGAVVAIGNAPTALFRLLEGLAEGWPKPAVILGFPVGFIGAAESKEALIEHAGGVPFLTLRGRRGGSAMAAAAVNALGSEPS